MKIRNVPLHELKPYENNVKQHPVQQLEVLVKSIKRYGFRGTVLIDKNNVIVAGHARYEAASVAGLTEIPCEYADDLTEDQITEFRILDNEIASMGYNDVDKFLAEAAKIPDFDFSEFNVELPEPSQKVKEGECDDDETPELKIESCTKLGDIWILGDHRLMCGDSTMIDSVESLMNSKKADMVFTDPPYGVNYTGGAKKREPLAGDQLGTEIYGQALPNLQIVAADHAALYLWYADAHASSAAAAAAAAAAGYEISAQIIWVKNNAQFVSAAKYHGKHEPCFYAHRKGKSAQWFGENNEVTVWEIDRNHKNEFHPTQKPIALAERAIGNSSKVGNVILDLFGGSGSTLIACEKTNRKCFMMEIAPNYCDVIIKRWQKFTGKEAILESTGKKFNELSPLV